jgi:predicted RNA methylase
LDNRKQLKLYDSINNGDIWSIFVRDEYQKLPVHGEVVIDIGANIGDSPLYFVSQGAKKVIALEPCPQSYSMATLNIKSNSFRDKVTLILAGCSANNGNVRLCSKTDHKYYDQNEPSIGF